MIGATATSEPVRKFDYYYDFRKDLRETTVITRRAGWERRGAGPGSALAADKNYDTAWQVASRGDPGAIIDVAFDRPERLREVVIFPADASRSPSSVVVEVSDDGTTWRQAVEVARGRADVLVGLAPVPEAGQAPDGDRPARARTRPGSAACASTAAGTGPGWRSARSSSSATAR